MRRTSTFCGIAAIGLGLLSACSTRGNDATLVLPLYRTEIAPGMASPGLAAQLTFNDRTASFIVDTGAGAHTLARWFVDAASLPIADGMSEGLRARDATGELMELDVVQAQTGRSVEGAEVRLDGAIVVDFPPMFEHAEIGGLLNPQLLAHADRAVVLDLRVPELRLEPFEEAVHRLDGQVLDDGQVRVCRSTEAAVPNLLFGVLVTNDEEGWLQLDTGAGVTSIAGDSGLIRGAALREGGEIMGLAGKPETNQVARQVALSFASHSTTVDAEVTSSGHPCGADGLLGLDAVAECAFVMSETSLAVTCGP
jgi:hypothetical protein